ncbi:nucleotidyltransferase domain-containing protein [Candidatus Woesearchaeota archaeon]|nr:nucleotidyltransferase domain-containing protein [Candidatus Woesearchaeota archaeon]
MKFDLPMREHPNMEKYDRNDIEKAHIFANEVYKELGALIRGVVLFGSSARKTATAKSDIDILVVIDDLQVSLTPEVTEAYRLIVKNKIARVSTRIHVTTLRFTAFWDYIRNGDPIGVNILRDGVALIDAGFFEPLQVLLKKGRIRPTKESIWSYYIRSPNTLHNSKWHILQASIDLYWAVIDAAHAALMKLGEIPPTPEHVADLLEEKMVKKKLLEAKYVTIMRNFYKLMKMITHRELKEIKGEEFDRNFLIAEDFVQRMRKFIEDEK